MKINTITEFKSFINELDLENRFTKDFLHSMFIEKDQELYILDIEKEEQQLLNYILNYNIQYIQ